MADAQLESAARNQLMQYEPKQYRSLRSQHGLTLIEIAVVLVLLGIILTVVGGKIFGAGDKAKRDLNRIKMQSLVASVKEYQLRYNSLPPTLDALINCTPDIGASCVPTASQEDLRDVWNNPFQYQLQNNGRSFVIKTLGADGVPGGKGPDFDDTINGP